MITTVALATQFAEKYDIDQAAAQTAVETYAGQINDDTDLFDYKSGELTDAGAEIVRDQFASDYAESGPIGSPSVTLDEAREAVRRDTSRINELRAELDRVLMERDDAVRHALEHGVRVPELMEDAETSRARIYQIRDRRR